MTDHLHLSTRHRTVIEALLRAHLPGVEAWAYGSRVNGRGHDGSDLDLVLRGPGLKEIPADQLRDFREAVGESGIPFLVEARDWARLPEAFRREIERGYVALVEGRPEQHEGGESDGPDSWRETVLGDLINLSHGFAFKGRFISDGPEGHVLLTPGNFAIGGGFKADKLKYYFGEVPERYILSEGDVIVNMTDLSKQSDTLGYPAVIPECKEGRRYLHNQRLGKVGLKDPGADARYIYYVMCGAAYRHEVLAGATGTTVKHTSPGRIKEFRFQLPPLTEQRAIAHILGTLDDKIELNRRMNETLEAMARALFKSWFIDFDPVRAKAALRAHDTKRANGPITPPWPDIKRQYDSKALHLAQAMGGEQTSAEGLLWYCLRNKQLGGYKFRRQQPIGPYIADFACLPQKLLIELDGGQHADRKAPDEQRDRFLRRKGYRALRFWNHEVFADCLGVLERVYEAVTHPPPPQPAPDGPASATPPQGGSDWNVERARAYLRRMDPDIAALFPDSFVDSELGEIPAGWAIEGFQDHFSLHRGLSYSGKGLCGQYEGLPMHNLNSIIEGGGYKQEGIKYYNGKYHEKHLVKPGDLIIANTEQGFDRLLVGHAAIVPENFGPTGLYSHHIYRINIRSVSPFTANFLCRLFNEAKMHSWISGFSNGTTINMLPTDALEIPLLVVPPTELVDSFTTMDRQALAKDDSNRAESHSLAALRDALLPKLVSGDIRAKH